MDWQEWHRGYEDPESSVSRRLRVVQARIREALDACPPGPIRVVSACSAEGRDLLGVLAGHPRAGDVTARLVELDPELAAAARRSAAEVGPARVEVVVGDAASADVYAPLAPAHLVLMCGVFGNIGEPDIEATVEHCTALCRRGGTVVWTRHRREPDVVPRICGWFEERGFARLRLSEPGLDFGVGAHRFAREPRPLAAGARMFTFRQR